MLNKRTIISVVLPRLLGPVVKLSMRYGLKLDDLINALKIALLDAASGELNRDESPVSISKLSVLSGLHRKDVARMLGENRGQGKPRNLVMKVIGQWQTDKRFVKNGQPKALQIEGKQSEFCRLVNAVSSDVSPYAVLFELERGGIIKKESGKAKLIAEIHSSEDNFEEGLNNLAQDLRDLVVCVGENISLSAGASNHHITTEFDNISPSDVVKIKAVLLKEGRSFHARLRKILSKFDRDINASEVVVAGKARVVVGSFGLVEVKS